MKKTADYLKEAQKALGHTTDGDTVRWLGASRPTVSRYLAGLRTIEDDDVLWKIAEALNIDWAEINAAKAAEKAEKAGDFEKVQKWENRFQTLSQRVASMSFLAIAISYGQSVIHQFCILC